MLFPKNYKVITTLILERESRGESFWADSANWGHYHITRGHQQQQQQQQKEDADANADADEDQDEDQPAQQQSPTNTTHTKVTLGFSLL